MKPFVLNSKGQRLQTYVILTYITYVLIKIITFSCEKRENPYVLKRRCSCMNYTFWNVQNQLEAKTCECEIQRELREVVNDHWAQFPPQIWGQNPMVVQFFAIFYFLVTSICVVGNILVIYVFLSNKELRIPVSTNSCFSSISSTGKLVCGESSGFWQRHFSYPRPFDVHQCFSPSILDVGSFHVQEAVRIFGCCCIW